MPASASIPGFAPGGVAADGTGHFLAPEGGREQGGTSGAGRGGIRRPSDLFRVPYTRRAALSFPQERVRASDRRNRRADSRAVWSGGTGVRARSKPRRGTARDDSRDPGGWEGGGNDESHEHPIGGLTRNRAFEPPRRHGRSSSGVALGRSLSRWSYGRSRSRSRSSYSGASPQPPSSSLGVRVCFHPRPRYGP